MIMEIFLVDRFQKHFVFYLQYLSVTTLQFLSIFGCFHIPDGRELVAFRQASDFLAAKSRQRHQLCVAAKAIPT